MEDKILRSMIRKEIISSLDEVDLTGKARGQVGSGLARVEKMASVKMLKKALGTGTPQQQAAGLLKVVQSISGNNPSVGKQLARMLMKVGIAAPEEPTPEPEPEVTDEAVNKQLSTRMDKVDKTQAMTMLRKALKNKPASQQAEFVADLVKKLDLKGNITLLIKKIRKAN